MLLGVVCNLAARKAPPERISTASKFTAGERGMLRIFAPAVAPHLGTVAEKTPEVALFGFVACLAVVAWGRVRELRIEGKKSEPKPAVPSTPKGRELSKEELEHRRLWGGAADAVKPGARIMDVGLPPRFKPSSP